MTFDSHRARSSIGNGKFQQNYSGFTFSVHLSGKHVLFLAADNYFLSIIAILGNAVISSSRFAQGVFPSSAIKTTLQLSRSHRSSAWDYFAASRRCLFYVD